MPMSKSYKRVLTQDGSRYCQAPEDSGGQLLKLDAAAVLPGHPAPTCAVYSLAIIGVSLL